MNYVKKLFKKIGNSFITGAADDDPSGLLTLRQARYSGTASFG